MFKISFAKILIHKTVIPLNIVIIPEILILFGRYLHNHNLENKRTLWQAVYCVYVTIWENGLILQLGFYFYYLKHTTLS